MPSAATPGMDAEQSPGAGNFLIMACKILGDALESLPKQSHRRLCESPLSVNVSYTHCCWQINKGFCRWLPVLDVATRGQASKGELNPCCQQDCIGGPCNAWSGFCREEICWRLKCARPVLHTHLQHTKRN